MTDPERISKRSFGLAAELLRAGSAEQPSSAGMERTLAALGVSGALLTSAGGATAAAGVAVASATKVVTATLLAKWIGVGVLGGVVLSGAAAAVSPAPAASSPPALRVAQVPSQTPAVIVAPSAAAAAVAAPAPAPARIVEQALVATSARQVEAPAVEAHDAVVELGAPLALEVAFIDRARAQLAAGRAEQGLLQLRRYEQEFPEARLLPEVLFLRMETCDRLGRSNEARTAATRLVEGFPKSPHATRARKLLSR